MRFPEVLTRSIEIAWRHRYLWLLAIAAGECGSGLSVPPLFTGTGGSGSTTSTDAYPSWLAPVTAWISDNAGLLIGLGLLLAVMLIGYFFLSCIGTAALIRAAGEIDGERPYGLAQAWRAGLRRYRPVLGLKVLSLLFATLVLVLFAALGVLGVLSAINVNTAGVVLAILGAIFLALLLIPAGVIGSVLYQLALRAAVLEFKGALPALAVAWRLASKRKGRAALSFLVFLGVGIACGFVAGIANLVAAIPVAVLVFLGWLVGNAGGAIAVGLILLPFYVAAAALVGSAVGTLYSTYWTLVYRRLDLEPIPSTVSYWPQPPPA